MIERNGEFAHEVAGEWNNHQSVFKDETNHEEQQKFHNSIISSFNGKHYMNHFQFSKNRMTFPCGL